MESFMEELPEKIAIIRLGGFTPTTWSVISQPRYAKHECKNKSEELLNFLKETKHSAVVICGNSEAPKEQKGKILGLAYCNTEVVRAERFIAEHMKRNSFSEFGFKYPWGLRIEKAIFFKEPYQRTNDILGVQLTKKIPRNKFLIIENINIINTIFKLERDYEITFGQDGKVDLQDTKKSKQADEEPHSTYIFRFSSRNCWKIGFSKDLVRRQNEFAKHVPSEVLGEQWKKHPYWSHEFSSRYSAKSFETVLLEAFRTKFDYCGERIQCNESDLKKTLFERLENYKLPIPTKKP